MGFRLSDEETVNNCKVQRLYPADVEKENMGQKADIVLSKAFWKMSLRIQEGTGFRYKNPISGLPCTDTLCNTSM